MANEPELSGLWRRTYLATADAVDTTTWVAWLQGLRYYCDLRQPVGLRTFPGVGCLRDLDDEHLVALADQQGFAGRLQTSGQLAQWHRDHDFHPPTGIADRATIERRDDLLIETGTEAPYVEHWTRRDSAETAFFDASVTDTGTGANGVIVLVGQWLMVARARHRALGDGQSLLAMLADTPELSDRQNLLDFEISFGTVDAARRWHVERSTLPFKAGHSWAVEFGAALQGTVEIEDLDAQGGRMVRRWTTTSATQERDRGSI